jgi:pterocarpan reductase
LQRFFPSEFGNDVDRVHAVEPAKSAFETKAKIRRTIEAEGIPYTYVSSNYFAGYFLPTLAQPGQFAPPPPKDKVVIYGDGNPKGNKHYPHLTLFTLVFGHRTLTRRHMCWCMTQTHI